MLRLPLLALFLGVAVVHAQQPNIVLIISDDAGFADWGFMDAYTQSVNPGQAPSPVPTPNLDALRARGVLFTDAYTAAVCSPSRAAILTGSYQQRIGYEFNINNLTDPNGNFEGLRSEDITILERMRTLDYTTGAIGKWHVGGIPDIVNGGVVTVPGNRPPRQGVDEFFGILRGSRNYDVGNHIGDATRALRGMFLDANGLEVNTELEAAHSGEYVTNTFGQGAVDFIDRHYDDTEPFFLYVSFTAPHGPIGPSPDINEPGINSNYGSMVFTMDKEIGRIMDKIADPAGDGSVDLTSETLFIFINDNGGASGNGTRNTPLRNWKGSTYEGGIRVPMIFAGAGITADPGTVYSEPVHSIDLVATCHELGGGAPLGGIDGVNLLPFVNGVADGSPHEAVVVRSRGKYGIRMDNWKLTRDDTGEPQLFDLSTDIDEANEADVSASNSVVVSQMLRILTEHETGFDKPRFHGLNAGADSINRNDHFIFAPQPPSGGTFTPDKPLVGPGLRNGDLESPVFASDQRPYSEADDWVNIGTGSQADVFIRTNQNRTSPQNAVMSEAGNRVAAVDTGHTIATGEMFGFSYWWRDASNWNDGADRIGFRFYTTVDDTINGAVANSQEYLSNTSTANATYELAEGTHTATAAEDGKRLFVAFTGVDGNGNANGFARVDDITVARGTVGAGNGIAMMDWASGGAWTDADTGLSDTLLDIDAFPGAVLEFPTTDGFSYVASNTMTRATGLDFMLNKLVLSGTTDGAGAATIDGKALLFTPSLDGSPAMIENKANGADNEFSIETPIVVWENLVIRGDGTAELTIAGGTREARPEVGVIVDKLGTSTLKLTGDQPISTSIDVREGTLKLEGANLDGFTSLWIREGATLFGSGQVGDTLDLCGTWVIDLSAGDRIDMETFEIEMPGTLRFEGTPTGDAQVFASYEFLDILTSAVQMEGLPPGHVVDFAYDGKQFAVRRDPYAEWAEVTSGLSGVEAAFDADPNGDGVANGLAFFLGAADATADARSLLPALSVSPPSASLSFGRADAAIGNAFRVRFSADLAAWVEAIDGQAGVTVQLDDDALGLGMDQVTVSVPLALAVDGQLFLDLLVQK